jgi:hypothetical protein
MRDARLLERDRTFDETRSSFNCQREVTLRAIYKFNLMAQALASLKSKQFNKLLIVNKFTRHEAYIGKELKMNPYH